MFGISYITKRHYNSVVDGQGRYGRLTFWSSFAVPTALAIVTFFFDIDLKVEVTAGFVSAFSIFVGLLLNVQAGMFALYDRDPRRPDDPKLASRYDRRDSNRRELIQDVSSKISYLLFVSILIVAICAVFLLVDPLDNMKIALLTFLFMHFVFTLLLLVEGVNALYAVEFTDA